MRRILIYPSQDSNHPDDLLQSRYVTPGSNYFLICANCYKFKSCIGHVSVEYRQSNTVSVDTTIGRLSGNIWVDCLSTDYRPMVGWQSTDVSVDIAADISTEATYSTHDPYDLHPQNPWYTPPYLVSAILVAMTIFLTPSGGRSNTCKKNSSLLSSQKM